MAKVNNESDSSRISKVGKENLQLLYEYALNSINRFQRKFVAIDSKASQTIGIIAVVGGIFSFAVPQEIIRNGSHLILLFIAIICLISSTLCCILCLRVRTILEAPSIEKIIKWIYENEEKNEIINIKILSAIIVDLGNAENSHLEAIEKKAKYLSIGQIFEVFGIFFLLIFAGFSRLFYSA